MSAEVIGQGRTPMWLEYRLDNAHRWAAHAAELHMVRCDDGDSFEQRVQRELAWLTAFRHLMGRGFPQRRGGRR